MWSRYANSAPCGGYPEADVQENVFRLQQSVSFGPGALDEARARERALPRTMLSCRAVQFF